MFTTPAYLLITALLFTPAGAHVRSLPVAPLDLPIDPHATEQTVRLYQRGGIITISWHLNNSWFWWGGSNCTPEELKHLWQFTVSYLRDEKQVHNLLYAYNTDRFTSEEAWLERYPGDEWTDIAGFDIYQANTISKKLPDSNWWTQTFMKSMTGQKIAYVMAWRNAGEKPGGQHEFYVSCKGQASAADFINFYNDPQTLFQKEVTKENWYR
jgi:beta-mannanase